MVETNDKHRFTFRVHPELYEYIEVKAREWKCTRTAALIRILNEYSQEQPVINCYNETAKLTRTDS